MKNQLLISLIIFFLMFSCSRENKNVQNSADITGLLMDTIRIDISENELPYYNKADFYFDALTGAPIFIGYNSFYHCYDLFDITAQSLVEKINLENDGPNEIPKNGNFNFLNKDTIIISSGTYFIKSDREGKVILKRKNLEFIEGTNFLFSHGVTVGIPENIVSVKNGEIISYILPRETYFWEDDFYVKPLFVSLNLENKTLKTLNINYPKEANSKNLFGALLKPYTLIVKNELIYNFPYSSKIYKYNFDKETISEYDVKSGFTENISKPLNFKELGGDISNLAIFNHFIYSLHFHKIVYDPFCNIYYRIHNNAPDKKDVKNTINYYLCVFDSNFKKIGEFEMDRKLVIYNYFPTKEGLIFQIMNNDNIEEINTLKFCRINFVNIDL